MARELGFYLTIAVAGWLGCWQPGRRASRTDPATALRAE